MSYAKEFETVDLIVNSTAKTRGVDAFALTLIKTERQIRKLFTFIVFQFPFLSSANTIEFREVLSENRRVYFEGFIKGFDSIYPRSVQNLIGQEYLNLYNELQQAIKYRNKIFHGQLTDKRLSREDLLDIVKSNRKWCELLATQSNREFGYDGFKRNSLRKSERNLWEGYKTQISTLAEYRRFIEDIVQRQA